MSDASTIKTEDAVTAQASVSGLTAEELDSLKQEEARERAPAEDSREATEERLRVASENLKVAKEEYDKAQREYAEASQALTQMNEDASKLSIAELNRRQQKVERREQRERARARDLLAKATGAERPGKRRYPVHPVHRGSVAE